MSHRFFSALAVAVIVAAPAVVHAGFDVFTSFEFTDTTLDFTLGDSPNSVQFLNGEAKTVGVFLLYNSGMNAWMVDSNQIGEILFETPASLVDLWFRDQNPDNPSALTFYDANDNVLATFDGLATMFQHVVVEGVGPIARITFQNNGAFGYSVIDDFGFTAIPAPSGMALFGLSGLALTRRRRR